MNRLLLPLALLVLALIAVATISHAQPTQADVYEVKVTSGQGRAFQPHDVTIPSGMVVRWVNVGEFAHTVTSTDSNADGEQRHNGLFRGGVSGKDDAYQHRFAEPGTFPYYCENHVTFGMTGQIIVTGEKVEDSPFPAGLALFALGAALLVYHRR